MKTLVLDANYRPISFINLDKLVRLYFNDKIEIISTWNEKLTNDINYPAIVKLKKYMRIKKISMKFSFSGIARRDKFQCQYTGDLLTKDTLTIDHLIPRSLGGKSSWENCVCCSKSVNRLKAAKMLGETNFTLLRQPKEPNNPASIEYYFIKQKHPDWADYFNDEMNI